MNHIDRVSRERAARAPYNFVPLPAKVAKANEAPDADRYHPARLTGHIEFDIETKTPLYIRGTITEDEMARADAREARLRPAFFGPGGQLRIPGSSLRGMLRALVAIVSSSRFQGYDDRRLFYRAVGDTSTVGDLYRGRLLSEPSHRRYRYEGQAGYLVKEAGRYFIYPAEEVGLDSLQIFRVEHTDATTKLGQAVPPFSRVVVDFKPARNEVHPHRRGAIELEYARVVDLQPAGAGAAPAGYKRGTLIVSGPMHGKHMHWIIAPIDKQKVKRIAVSDDDLALFRDGGEPRVPPAREGQYPILPDGNQQIPCFFNTRTQDGKVRIEAFGHTGMFRLPYRKSIDGAVPDAAKRPVRDMAEAIFGVAANGEDGDRFAGRVFVHDAPLLGDAAAALLPVSWARILDGPKPTTFQHYLKQGTEERRFLKTWDSDGAEVRGAKLYWHRQGVEWRELLDENINESTDTQHTKIQPIKIGQKFTGLLRFENLTEEELGAILFALDLPSDCAHKLGIGKPLGLGSVRITVNTLYIDDRLARYERLFSAESNRIKWHRPPLSKAMDKAHYKDKFASWALGKDATANDIWGSSRLKTLRTLLSWDHQPPAAATEYMELTSFTGQQGRRVLPTPEQVADYGAAWQASTLPHDPPPAPGIEPGRGPTRAGEGANGAPQAGDLRKGDRLTGRVKNILDFGVFVDLGLTDRKDGLLHVSVLGRRVLSTGQTVEVEVLDVKRDPDLRKGWRISLKLID